jgi:hypothetical protein
VAVVAAAPPGLHLARRRRASKVAAAELGLAGGGDLLPPSRPAAVGGAAEAWCGPLPECSGAVVERVDEGLPEVEEELRAASAAGTTATIAQPPPQLPGAVEEDDAPAGVLALLERVRAAEAALDHGWAVVTAVDGRRARLAGAPAGW